MSSESVDGDSGGSREDEESVDGDEAGGPAGQVPQPSAAATTRARNVAREFRSKGPLMIFLILASAHGLWSADLKDLDLHSWTDTVYGRGDRQASLVGAVLGNWEFISGLSEQPSTDESIFVDLARLAGGGQHGMLIYSAVNSVVLDSAASACQFPSTTFALLKQFKDYMVKEYSATGPKPPSQPFSHYIRQWKQVHGITSAGVVVACLAPKAAWMAVNGWKTWHAVPVAKSYTGTLVLGTVTPWLLIFEYIYVSRLINVQSKSGSVFDFSLTYTILYLVEGEQ